MHLKSIVLRSFVSNRFCLLTRVARDVLGQYSTVSFRKRSQRGNTMSEAENTGLASPREEERESQSQSRGEREPRSRSVSPHTSKGESRHSSRSVSWYQSRSDWQLCRRRDTEQELKRQLKEADEVLKRLIRENSYLKRRLRQAIYYYGRGGRGGRGGGATRNVYIYFRNR
ncbi:uncharacterized protein LOC128896999 [Hylaeus anthracinus]|uniref:uncharacterized protein LOC128896999 n=1 Tax=Hylaeus anthracinus TaxID=313031 RepID=UPI0023B8EFE0|nr:uncharacterized protein LOC128896999 [Hylaeus anthracinus]